MKFNNQGEQEVAFTVIVNVPASPLHNAFMVSETPMTEFRGFPTDNFKSVKRKENRFNPKQVFTQFIYKHLGEPDEKSLEHQMKGNKVRLIKGRIDRGMAQMQFPIDFICAQVLSKVHDSISGKMEGISFTYASNELNFKAVWHYGKNKFVIINE